MNKIILILFLFPSISYSGLRLNGSQGSLAATGNEEDVKLTTITITCRVFLNANQTARQFVINAGANDGSTPGFGWGISDASTNKMKFYNANAAGTSNHNLDGNATLPNLTWINVAAVFITTNTGTNKFLYINGELDNSAATAVPLGYASDCRYSIGYWAPPSLQLLNGRIEDVRIYNRALSRNELRTLGKTNVKLLCSKADGCMAYNRLDEGFATTIAPALANSNYDLSGNGTSLAPQGSPIWGAGISSYP